MERPKMFWDDQCYDFQRTILDALCQQNEHKAIQRWIFINLLSCALADEDIDPTNPPIRDNTIFLGESSETFAICFIPIIAA